MANPLTHTTQGQINGFSCGPAAARVAAVEA